MNNINGEKINEALFNKKSSEKLNEINNILNETDCGTRTDSILKSISEYGMIMYSYGAFMHGNNA